MRYDMVTPIKNFFKDRISHVSSETMGWLAILFLHGATVPSMLALMTGLTDTVPPMDVVFMVWFALMLLFVKASIQRDLLNIITIGLGFVVQAVMMALIFFK